MDGGAIGLFGLLAQRAGPFVVGCAGVGLVNVPELVGGYPKLPEARGPVIQLVVAGEDARAGDAEREGGELCGALDAPLAQGCMEPGEAVASATGEDGEERRPLGLEELLEEAERLQAEERIRELEFSLEEVKASCACGSETE